jgi:hypothetical protein
LLVCGPLTSSVVVRADSANNVTFRLFGQAIATLPEDGVRVSGLIGDVLVPVAIVVLLALVTDPRTLTRGLRKGLRHAFGPQPASTIA